VSIEPGGVAGIVLAAGFGKRFGDSPKLLARLGGVSLLERALQAYSGANVTELLVVVAPDLEVAELAERYQARIVRNRERAAGQSASLRAGLGAVSPGTVAAVFGVADQPFLTGEVIRRLVEEFHLSGGPIVVPRYAGHPGSPVVFARRYFARLLQIQGDLGGRSLVASAPAEDVRTVSFADPMLGLDIDTPEDLARAEAYLT
jgi:molybdenum cofactor cytidylyltransferase